MHIDNVPSRTTYSLKGTESQSLNAAPEYLREMTLAIDEVNSKFLEHTITVHGLKDLQLAQNRDVQVLAIKKVVAKNPSNMKYFLKTCAFSQEIFTNKRKTYF